jgi:antagonist of KipI
MEVKIHKAGLLTTVQDLGRTGHRSSGVPVCGPMDTVAFRLANLLVGNNETTAALEITLLGPEIEFSEDRLIAVCGAQLSGIEVNRPHLIKKGQKLNLGACTSGVRSYLAISGGITTELILGSQSTYLRGSFGGFKGRALKQGDLLSLGKGRTLKEGLAKFYLSGSPIPPYSSALTLRVTVGAQHSEFAAGLFTQSFKVSPVSDRMGLRLQGKALQRKVSKELTSSAVVCGTIQVPADGQPIILMADAQTLGGYPQIAHVCAVDLPLVAQLKALDAVEFSLIALSNAHELLRQREHEISLIREGLSERFYFSA